MNLKRNAIQVVENNTSSKEILLSNASSSLIMPNTSIFLVKSQANFNQREAKRKEEELLLSRKTQFNSVYLTTEKCSKYTVLVVTRQPQSSKLNETYNTNISKEPDSCWATHCFNQAAQTDTCNIFHSNPVNIIDCQFSEGNIKNVEMINESNVILLLEPYSSFLESNRECHRDTINNYTNSVESTFCSQIESHLQKTEMSTSFFQKTEGDNSISESVEHCFTFENDGFFPEDESCIADIQGSHVSILNSNLNQSNENCGLEFLKNVITNKNPIIYRLPEF